MKYATYFMEDLHILNLNRKQHVQRYNIKYIQVDVCVCVCVWCKLVHVKFAMHDIINYFLFVSFLPPCLSVCYSAALGFLCSSLLVHVLSSLHF